MNTQPRFHPAVLFLGSEMRALGWSGGVYSVVVVEGKTEEVQGRRAFKKKERKKERKERF